MYTRARWCYASQLEGCKRNQDAYDKIAADLWGAGFERTGEQCWDKIKKLKGEYRKVKDKRNKTWEVRFPEWDYFDSMDTILGHWPATKPPVVVNSISDAEVWAGDTTDDTGDDSTTDPAGDPQPNKGGILLIKNWTIFCLQVQGHSKTLPVALVQTHQWHLSKGNERGQKEIKLTLPQVNRLASFWKFKKRVTGDRYSLRRNA